MKEIQSRETVLFLTEEGIEGGIGKGSSPIKRRRWRMLSGERVEPRKTLMSRLNKVC